MRRVPTSRVLAHMLAHMFSNEGMTNFLRICLHAYMGILTVAFFRQLFECILSFFLDFVRFSPEML